MRASRGPLYKETEAQGESALTSYSQAVCAVNGILHGKKINDLDDALSDTSQEAWSDSATLLRSVAKRSGLRRRFGQPEECQKARGR